MDTDMFTADNVRVIYFHMFILCYQLFTAEFYVSV